MIRALSDGGRPPDVEHPYWREPSGERTTFVEVAIGLDGRAARQMAERHADAIRALASAASDARLAGEHTNARRLAHTAARLCEETAGLWPRDSWKPIR